MRLPEYYTTYDTNATTGDKHLNAHLRPACNPFSDTKSIAIVKQMFVENGHPRTNVSIDYLLQPSRP
jgi:hypothetical protein